MKPVMPGFPKCSAGGQAAGQLSSRGTQGLSPGSGGRLSTPRERVLIGCPTVLPPRLSGNCSLRAPGFPFLRVCTARLRLGGLSALHVVAARCEPEVRLFLGYEEGRSMGRGPAKQMQDLERQETLVYFIPTTSYDRLIFPVFIFSFRTHSHLHLNPKAPGNVRNISMGVVSAPLRSACIFKLQ